jgi:hypothetical protein
MTLALTRLDVMTVVKQIQTDWTAYPLLVETDNRVIIDQATQANPYLRVEIVPLVSDQMDLGAHPHVRQTGQILLYAVAKEGAGAALSEALLDFVTPYFDLKRFTTIQCHSVQAQKPIAKTGWWWNPAIVNYFYFRAT